MECNWRIYVVKLAHIMPKEVKAKGERKKRAKKGIVPSPIPLQIPLIAPTVNSTLTCFVLIDPNAPKRGLSAYMFFAQVCARSELLSRPQFFRMRVDSRLGEPRFGQERESRYHLWYIHHLTFL
jgi:hypothetical protein